MLHALDLPAIPRSAHREHRHLLQIRTPLGEPGEGALSDIRREQLLCPSSSFGFEPERLWCQGPYLPRHPDVALDRREAHPEKAGGLGFRHPPFDHRFDDLLPEVPGVRVRATMLLEGQPHCNTLLFTVVRGSRILGSTRSPDPPPQGILSPFGFDAPIVPGARITSPRGPSPSDWGGAPKACWARSLRS